MQGRVGYVGEAWVQGIHENGSVEKGKQSLKKGGDN